jgi:acyl-coenzyme A synthetase/AMP-(fatty) acid ligase
MDEVHLVPGSVKAGPLLVDRVVVDPDVCWGEPSQRHDRETRWFVYTSGTTGSPKVISHTIQTLSRTIKTDSRSADLRWGLLYDPARMAGLQVLLQALRSGATVVAPHLLWRLTDKIRFLEEHGVTALSATPTLWRMMLQITGTLRLPLRQITLGGEIADQGILNSLRSAFPGARIVHIFASTETGAAFSVTDGLAGFPVDYLYEPPGGVPLQVRDGELYVYSPGVSAAGDDGFAPTGDVVEADGDRFFFRGRFSGVVNVGGTNVWPEEVESVLRSHPAVAEARVTAVANPIAGSLLIAQVVLRAPESGGSLGKELRRWMKSQVDGPLVPAKIQVVDQLGVSATGKLVRRG